MADLVAEASNGGALQGSMVPVEGQAPLMLAPAPVDQVDVRADVDLVLDSHLDGLKLMLEEDGASGGGDLL